MNTIIKNLTKVVAYTIHSQDDERTSSNKGVYKDSSIASAKAHKSGWYGTDGDVRQIDDIFQDENGELYNVKYIGQYTDVSEKIKEDTIASIKSKLTDAELKLLGIK